MSSKILVRKLLLFKLKFLILRLLPKVVICSVTLFLSLSLNLCPGLHSSIAVTLGALGWGVWFAINW